MSPVAIAAIVFVVGTSAILAFAFVYAFTSTHRSVTRRTRAEGRAAVPYWHTDDGIEEERGLVSHEEPRSGNVA